MTSIGCGDSKEAPGEKVYEVLKPVLVQKDKAEAALKVGLLGFVAPAWLAQLGMQPLFPCLSLGNSSKPSRAETQPTGPPNQKAHADKMAYTIIRPGGLMTEAATGNGVLTEAVSACGAITREDTAALVVKALFSKNTDNKTLSAVDKGKLSTQQPFEPFAL